MIALSYGSMDAPTSENYWFSLPDTNSTEAQLYHILSLRHKHNTQHAKWAGVLSCCSPDYVEMWIVMVSMVSGCLMYTVLVANATAMIANLDPAAKEYKSKVLMGYS